MNSIPEQMRAVWVAQPGGTENLTVKILDTPRPRRGEVLIKVAAAGINHSDMVMRRGTYPRPPEMSQILGLEVSGTVAAVGEGVAGFSPGTEVCALVSGGGYAEYCIAPVETMLPIPVGIALRDAAGLPEVYATVWMTLFDRAGLTSGQTLLVHGGTSGIGTAAIMLAKRFGARIFATAGTDQKCWACRELGADFAINYRSEDFVEVVTANTETGVDVILDVVGGAYLSRNIQCLAPEGRLISIGLQSAAHAEIDLAPILFKWLTIIGSTLHNRDRAFKKGLMDRLTEKVWPLFDDGSLRVIVDSSYPMERAADAHERMEAGLHIGKILLTME